MSLRTWYANLKRRRLYGACLATSPQVISLRYHSVGDPQAVSGYLDPGLSVSPARFREQLQILASRFVFLLPSEIAAFREGGHGDRRGVVITFDDGYRDNHDEALPLLVDEGGRACFYVTTGPLTSGRGLWISELFRVVDRLPAGMLSLPGHEALEVAREPQARVPLRRRLTRWLASISAEAREAAFDAMAARADIPRGEGLEESFMTPGHLRAMRRAGMGIGAHTRSHPHLDKLPPELHADEVSGSRADLERILDEPVTDFAYPNPGGGGEALPPARASVEKAGFRTAVTSTPAPLDDQSDLLRLPRVGVYAGAQEKLLFSMLEALPSA